MDFQCVFQCSRCWLAWLLFPIVQRQMWSAKSGPLFLLPEKKKKRRAGALSAFSSCTALRGDYLASYSQSICAPTRQDVIKTGSAKIKRLPLLVLYSVIFIFSDNIVHFLAIAHTRWYSKLLLTCFSSFTFPAVVWTLRFRLCLCARCSELTE